MDKRSFRSTNLGINFSCVMSVQC